MTRANRIGLRQESGQSVCPWPPKPWCSGAPIVGELVIERKFVTTPHPRFTRQPLSRPRRPAATRTCRGAKRGLKPRLATLVPNDKIVLSAPLCRVPEIMRKAARRRRRRLTSLIWNKTDVVSV